MFLHHFHNSLFGCHFGSRKTLNLLLKKYWQKDIAQQVDTGSRDVPFASSTKFQENTHKPH